MAKVVVIMSSWLAGWLHLIQWEHSRDQQWPACVTGTVTGYVKKYLTHCGTKKNILWQLGDTYRSDVDVGLVPGGVVGDDGALHLPATVGQVDPLARHELGVGADAGEAGPDEV